jgi:hypothetical protein
MANQIQPTDGPRNSLLTRLGAARGYTDTQGS